MHHKWQRKYRKDINRRIFNPALDRREWCRSLCQILIWYGDKHPESGIDIERASKALEAINSGADITIKRDGSGFDYKTSSYIGRKQYGSIRMTGLPALPQPYTQEA